MSSLKTTLFLLLLCLAQSAIAQQVYRSTDSEGNVTFSDTPAADSDTVDIPAPNVGDSVEIPAAAPAPVQPAEPQPELVADPLPENLEGKLEGKEKSGKSRKNRRPRPTPYNNSRR